MSAPNPRHDAQRAGPLQVALVLADMACSTAAAPQRAIDALLPIALLACADAAARDYVRQMADEAKTLFAQDTTP